MKIIKLNKKIIVLGIIIICGIALAIRPPKTRLTSANATGKYHILVDVEESKMYILQDRSMYKNIRLLRWQIFHTITHTEHGQL